MLMNILIGIIAFILFLFVFICNVLPWYLTLQIYRDWDLWDRSDAITFFIVMSAIALITNIVTVVILIGD
jgi:hypothetical protein